MAKAFIIQGARFDPLTFVAMLIDWLVGNPAVRFAFCLLEKTAT